MARILHVEGDNHWRTLVRSSLADHHVDSAASIDETIRLLEFSSSYDVALVELNLLSDSDNQGGEILHLLQERYPSTRRIVVTSTPPGGSIRRNIFERYDVEELIIKGDFDLPGLRRAIEEAVSRGMGPIPQSFRLSRSALRQRFRDWQRMQADRLRGEVRKAEEILYNAAKVSVEAVERAQLSLEEAKSREAIFTARCGQLRAIMADIENSDQFDIALQALDAAEEFFNTTNPEQRVDDRTASTYVQVSDTATREGADFFISYTQSDQAWAEWVAWEIEEAGYRVFIQAWDTYSGRDGVLSMHEGVQNASHTIAILSPEYLVSEFANPEWQAAWARDPDGEERKLITLRVADCERPTSLSPLVGIELVGLSESVARNRLLSSIKRLIGNRSKPTTRPAFPPGGRPSREREFPGTLPQVWNVPARDPSFTGRRRLLKAIKDSWDEIGKVSVQVLHGPGGIGKTMTAVEYAHAYAADYDIVWWINAEEHRLLTDQLAALAGPLALPSRTDPSSQVQAVRVELRRRGGWLLVLDNATDVEELRAVIPDGAGHILVTTRENGFSEIGGVSNLEVLDRRDSIDIIRNRLPSLNNDQANIIANELGDHPLAITQAAAYIDELKISVDNYIELLGARGGELIKGGIAAGETGELGSVWSLSVEALRTSRPAAVELLELGAWLATEPIPLDLFTDHPERLPEHLAIAAADPLTLAETVKALVDYGLARRTGNGLLLHRLVQDAIREGLAPSIDQLSLVAALLRIGLPQKVSGTPENWPRWRQLLPHVLAVTGRYDE